MANEKQRLFTSVSNYHSDVQRTLRAAGPLERLWRHDCCSCMPARYTFALTGFLGFFIVYALRVNLFITIVEMVGDTAGNSSHRQYQWSHTEQGWVLGAFFYGYCITQIPGGWLAERYSAKMVYGMGIFVTALLTLLTPLAAGISVWLLVALRVAEGLCEGVVYPAMHSLLGVWAPVAERSRLATFIYSGAFVGTMVSFPISAVLCVYGFDGGWPSVFYVMGTAGILWFLLYLLVVFDSPSVHPRISVKERLYITKNLELKDDKIPTPWLQIFTSPAVWAITVAFFCYSWNLFTLLTCMPTYFKEVLKLFYQEDIIINGLYSAIPYTLFAICTILGGYLADFLHARCLSTMVVRKLFTVLPFGISAAALLLTSYFGNESVTAVLYLTISVGVMGFSESGVTINHVDIAPRFAGILMGITNTAATIPGFVGPQLAKALTPNGTRSEWQVVFIIAAELSLFGACIYLILADGKKQWWADGVIKNDSRALSYSTEEARATNS